MGQKVHTHQCGVVRRRNAMQCNACGVNDPLTVYTADAACGRMGARQNGQTDITANTHSLPKSGLTIYSFEYILLSQFGQVITEILWFFNFSRRRPFVILDVFASFLYHPRSVFGSLYWCAKFGWNPCIISIIWKFEYFALFVWKCLITTPYL